MSLAVRLRPEAEADLKEAAAWYQRQREGLGVEFLDTVLATIDAIMEQPSRYPVVHRRVRRALMRRFPFGLYYRVEPDCVVVIAILHGSRHPGHWQRRA